jgi:hypothetical protein
VTNSNPASVVRPVSGSYSPSHPSPPGSSSSVIPVAVVPPPAPAIDDELERKRQELLEMERKIFEEREKHRRAEEKTKSLAAKKKLISDLDEKIKKAASLDVVFLLDCTGSMYEYIEATKNNISEFVTNITAMHPDVVLRLAFIGYRDHCDQEERLAVLRFTHSLPDFQEMVSQQAAKGGGDDCEDVLGGLHVVRGLDWTSETRILYHIGDAPCHGREYHSPHVTDDHPTGDPNGLSVTDLLKAIKELKITYFFGRIQFQTDLMIKKFNEAINPSHPTGFIHVTPMSGGTMMEVVTKSVATSFAETLSASTRTVEGEGKLAKKEVFLDYALPDFETMATEEALRYEMTMPKTVQEMIRQLEETDEDKCISDFPDSDHVFVKSAKYPFAKGEMRAAYWGQAVSSSTGSTIEGSEAKALGTILKESLAVSPTQLTKPKYEAFLSCHRAAKALSMEFNRCSDKPANCPAIEFCDACIIQFMARRGQPFMIQESQITDVFEKYNNNSGFIAANPTLHGTRHEAVQAFSHWSYAFTNGQMMVVDCQGGYNVTQKKFLLTDPAIHFVDVTHFGGTNMGRSGMQKFFESHVCNEYCKAMNLEKPASVF